MVFIKTSAGDIIGCTTWAHLGALTTYYDQNGIDYILEFKYE